MGTAVENASDTIRGFLRGLSGLSNEQVAQMCVMSPAVHFASCVQILNKKKDLVRPVPNILQLRMSAAYEFFREIDRPLKLIVCKPRQVGCSTFAGQMGTHYAKSRRVEGLVISDKRDNSINLVQRIEEYHQNDRFPWKVSMKVSSEEVKFSNGSEFAVDSAENPKAGIGRTRNFFHASEVAKWPKTTSKNDKRTMGAVLPSVPKEGFTLVIAESTPEGASGWMYETWQGAMTLEDAIAAMESGVSHPGNGWVKVFAAWFEFAEHTIERITGLELTQSEIEQMRRTLTLREREGIKKYGWTWGQVAWRRLILDTECNGDENLLDEYYPEDEIRCWSVSGRPRFSVEGMNRMEFFAKHHPSPQMWKLGEMDGDVPTYSPVATVGESDALIWEEPKAGMAYLITLDPATGAMQTGSKDPDAHSVGVWRRGYSDGKTYYKHKLVARLVPGCRWEVKMAAEAVKVLSALYGRAIVVLEVNMGLGFMELFQMMGVPMYQREVLDPSMPNREEPKMQIGFKLKDQSMRDSLVECLATSIRQGDIEIPCLHVIQELRTFIRGDDGKSQARPGCHDDDVMSTAMGVYCLPSATVMSDFLRKKRKPRYWDKWRRMGRVIHRQTL